MTGFKHDAKNNPKEMSKIGISNPKKMSTPTILPYKNTPWDWHDLDEYILEVFTSSSI